MKIQNPFLIIFNHVFFFFYRTTSTTSKPPKSRGRPPFLRPIAKFTDIKISALENIGKKKQNKQNNNAPVDDTDKDKPESKKCVLSVKRSLLEKKNQLILIVETRKNIPTEVEFFFSSYFTDTTIAVFLSIIRTKNKILIWKKKKVTNL